MGALNLCTLFKVRAFGHLNDKLRDTGDAIWRI